MAQGVSTPLLRRAVGFEAGKTGRRLRSIPTTSQAINSQIRTYGRNVVTRSRYLATNNSYAVAAKEEYIAALVGCGIKPSTLIKDRKVKAEIQTVWRRWTDEADADGLTDYYGLQSIIASELFEAGECFVRFRDRFLTDGFEVPLQMQLLPTEMLPTDYNEVLPNGGRVECGIEFSPIGKRVAYHFLRNHPGEAIQFNYNANQRIRVPAEEVLHLYRPIRAGQIRGLPHTLSGIVTLALIDLYDDAELERKRIAALFGAFVTRKAGETAEEHPFQGAAVSENENDNSLSNFTLEPGAVVDLAEGQDIKFAEPADVGSTYDSFQYRNLTRAAAGFGSTYFGMTGDLRQVNYSSIREGRVAFRRRIEAQQHHIMVFQLCRPVWRRWLDTAVRVGALETVSATDYLADLPGYRDAKHIPPKVEWVDPLKDLQAEVLAVENGFKARSDVIESLGEDPEEVDARIVADKEREAELGLQFNIKLVSDNADPNADPKEDPNADPKEDPNADPQNPDNSGEPTPDQQQQAAWDDSRRLRLLRAA